MNLKNSLAKEHKFRDALAALCETAEREYKEQLQQMLYRVDRKIDDLKLMDFVVGEFAGHGLRATPVGNGMGYYFVPYCRPDRKKLTVLVERGGLQIGLHNWAEQSIYYHAPHSTPQQPWVVAIINLFCGGADLPEIVDLCED
jgi:hypothetical protein